MNGKTRVLFATFSDGASGPQRWLEGLLRNEKFRAETCCSVWYVPDLYRGVIGKIRLLRDCRQQISSKKFDKIYINQDLNMAALLTLNFRLLGFTDLIVHSHAPRYYTNNKLLKPFSYLTIVRFLVKQKIAVSEGASIAMYGVNAKNVAIIPAFIDFESLWEKSFERIPYRKSDDQVVFGCVGRLSREKNQDLIIRCLAKIRDRGVEAYVVLVGDGGLRSEYEAQSRVLGLENNVIFVGEVENVAPYYRSFIDVLLVPSLYEGVVRTVAEAQLFGLPVVVSDAIVDETFLTTECVYRVGSYKEDDWASIMEERAKNAPEKNNMNLETALAHSTLAMNGGVNKVLEQIVGVCDRGHE